MNMCIADVLPMDWRKFYWNITLHVIKYSPILPTN